MQASSGQLLHRNLLGEVLLDVLHHGRKAVGGGVLAVVVEQQLPGLGLHEAHQHFLNGEVGQHVLDAAGAAGELHEALQGAGQLGRVVEVGVLGRERIELPGLVGFGAGVVLVEQIHRLADGVGGNGHGQALGGRGGVGLREVDVHGFVFAHHHRLAGQVLEGSRPARCITFLPRSMVVSTTWPRLRGTW